MDCGTKLLRPLARGVLVLLFVFSWMSGSAQSHEAQQLLLNVEKLGQMKNILRDMKRGYEVLSGGYTTVRDIVQGNFSLHEVFLDGLMLVSPEVRKYRRVADIVGYHRRMVTEYKSALKSFHLGAMFSASEMGYIERVYGQLLSGSLDNLEELAMVITSSQLRMSDEERLRAVDRIFADMEDKLIFLRDFNDRTHSLGDLRAQQRKDLRPVGQLHDKL